MKLFCIMCFICLLTKLVLECLSFSFFFSLTAFYAAGIQHVLERGKPHERSAIIQELAGKIVQMSQQKFASNVVEKCLTFSNPSERQLLVNEMLGTTDENEPLQVCRSLSSSIVISDSILQN